MQHEPAPRKRFRLEPEAWYFFLWLAGLAALYLAIFPHYGLVADFTRAASHW